MDAKAASLRQKRQRFQCGRDCGKGQVSPGDNPEMYRFESALTHVPAVTAPFLIFHGAADPMGAFNNSLAFHNALRFNNKKAIVAAPR